MDEVRARRIGDEQLNYLGYSLRHRRSARCTPTSSPTDVRAMVLDGVVDARARPGSSAADDAGRRASRRALDALRRRLRRSDGLRDSGDPTPTRSSSEVHRRGREAGPIPAPDADRPAGPGEVQPRHRPGPLRREPVGRRSPTRCDDAARRRRQRARRPGRRATCSAADGSRRFEVYFAVSCLDATWPTATPTRSSPPPRHRPRTSPHFGEALVNDYVRCAIWPATPAAARRPVTAAGLAADPRDQHHRRPGDALRDRRRGGRAAPRAASSSPTRATATPSSARASPASTTWSPTTSSTSTVPRTAPRCE